jgi:hypothetical protein
MKIPWQFAFYFLLLFPSLAFGQESSASTSQVISHPLEVHLASPPRWKNRCLELRVRRTNHSKSPIFLPVFTGILIYSTVTDATNTLGQAAGVVWFPVYGMSGIIDAGFTRVAPGETVQDTYCIWDTFTVMDSLDQMRRQVRLQGNLQIYASYYLEEPNWLLSKWRKEQMAHTSPSQWKNADRWNGGRVMTEIPIPCPKDVTKKDCACPPPIFQGEHSVAIPDVGE